MPTPRGITADVTPEETFAMLKAALPERAAEVAKVSAQTSDARRARATNRLIEAAIESGNLSKRDQGRLAAMVTHVEAGGKNRTLPPIRVTKDEHERMVEDARKEGITLTELLRRRVLRGER